MRTHKLRATLTTSVLLMMTFAVTATVVAQTQYPIMRPDRETMNRWFADYRRAPEVKLQPTKEYEARTSYTLLHHLDYVPAARNQASCGNCWAWAGTGCAEITHHVENGVFNRLSVQLINSAYAGGTGDDYACCGGWLSDFASFYGAVGFMIPWSNSSAQWQDGNTGCGGSTNIAAASISTTPNYLVPHINELRIATQEESQATAITNIRTILNNETPVWFSFFLADFGPFRNFWNNQPETAIWDFDGHCGGSYEDGPDHGGHAVLCVGYNDDDPANPYWIMVNSWGTAGGNRPNGVFRVDMDMDYGCQFSDLDAENGGYALYWQILDIDFGNRPPVCDAGGPYEVQCNGKTMLDARDSYDPEEAPLSYSWETDCPDATFNDDTSPTPVLIVGSDGTCETSCTVWLTVEDDQNLTSECTAEVTVIDNQSPEVTLPPNRRLECESDVPAPDTSLVQATDCVDVQVRHIEDVNNGGGGCPGDPLIISRTYRVTDVCGNPPTDKVQTFTIVDDEAPVITVFPANAGLKCRGETPKPNPNLISATDNCGGPVEVTWEGDTKNNGIGCPGDPLIVWRTYRVTDECGNYVERIQQYNIVDDVPPTFTEFPADEDLQCITELPDPDIDLLEADDNCFGPVEITWEGDTDNGGSGCPGDPLIVTRTYRATDLCGNFFERDQTFTIIDTEAPTIECSITNDVQPVEVDENCEAYVEFSVTVTDNCCVDPADVKINAYVVTANATLGPIELDPLPPTAASVTVTGRVKVSDLTCCPATVEVTADATDCCDHPAPQCVTMVDVIDNYPPAGACGLTHDHPGCNFIDNMVELTANEPSYWSALSGQPKGTIPFDTLDPGWLPGRPDPDSVDSGDRVLRGYVVAWAVNEFGEEIRWNHLKGDAVLVNYGDGSAWEYSAYAFQARNVVHGALTGTPGVLYLDGVEYDTGFDQLLLDFYAVGATALSGTTQTFTVDTDLTLLPLDIDLRQDNDGPVTTKAKFDIWNMNEWKFSGTERCITCWDQALLSNYDDPNHFLLRSIQTDKGRARIDGLASSVCPDSAEASLLGVAMKMLAFDGEKGFAQAGMNLVGAGAQQGVIQADVLGEPPKTRRSDRRWAKDASAACSEVTSNVEKGSVLIFPKVEIRWDWCGNVIQDTFIDLTNDYPGDVLVQMYFVNGDPPMSAALPRCVGP